MGDVAFTADAPWDLCEHENYVEGCHGCFVAMTGQIERAEQWQAAIGEAFDIVKDLALEVRTMTRLDRDEHQARSLLLADQWLRRMEAEPGDSGGGQTDG